MLFVIFFTLGLGTLVLKTSSRKWILNSQGDNIIILGHQDVIDNYSSMYKMFSSPNIMIYYETINFTDPKYMFNLSDVDNLKNFDGIDGFDERLINFFDVKEIPGYHYFEDIGYQLVGKNRQANIPLIGVNSENIIQTFEIEGKFFTNEEAYYNITIAEGLAYDLFDYALDQSLKLTAYGDTFHISGVLIDSFYCGHAGYMGLTEIRTILNLLISFNSLHLIHIWSIRISSTFTSFSSIRSLLLLFIP